MTADCFRSTQVRRPPRFRTNPMMKATRAKAMPRSTMTVLMGLAAFCARRSPEASCRHGRDRRAGVAERPVAHPGECGHRGRQVVEDGSRAERRPLLAEGPR